MGIDVGGTKIAAGLVKFPSGALLIEQTIPTGPEPEGDSVLDRVAQLAEKLILYETKGNIPFCGTGVGLCELVDPAGKILSQNCLPWDEKQVRKRLAHLGPVTLEADVRAAACAEASLGAGRRYRIFLYITVGTGIACSLVVDGMPFLGAHGTTGTMASSPVSVPCESCGHIDQASLEEIASGPALVNRFNQLRPGAAATAQDILAAAERGDTDAARVVRNATETLGSAIGSLVNVLDPHAVIIGGGLGLSGGSYWKTLVASTRRHIWHVGGRDIPLLQAATGIRAGLIGAAITAWQSRLSKYEKERPSM
ncbi:MAG: ROK family protein [Verrucomicrobia subdivision 3 bacterium]|nr:ROK family protein [Limisphaerales bacterium]